MLAASVLPDNDVAPAALVCRALHLHALSGSRFSAPPNPVASPMARRARAEQRSSVRHSGASARTALVATKRPLLQQRPQRLSASTKSPLPKKARGRAAPIHLTVTA